MIKIRPINARYDIKIGKSKDQVVITVRPLKFSEKSDINSQVVKYKEGSPIFDSSKSAFLTLKHSIVDIKGILDEDGSKYELKKDENDLISDECMEEILESEISGALILFANEHISKTPDKITNPLTGEELPGVSIKRKDSKQKK